VMMADGEGETALTCGPSLGEWLAYCRGQRSSLLGDLEYSQLLLQAASSSSSSCSQQLPLDQQYSSHDGLLTRNSPRKRLILSESLAHQQLLHFHQQAHLTSDDDELSDAKTLASKVNSRYYRVTLEHARFWLANCPYCEPPSAWAASTDMFHNGADDVAASAAAAAAAASSSSSAAASFAAAPAAVPVEDDSAAAAAAVLEAARQLCSGDESSHRLYQYCVLFGGVELARQAIFQAGGTQDGVALALSNTLCWLRARKALVDQHHCAQSLLWNDALQTRLDTLETFTLLASRGQPMLSKK